MMNENTAVYLNDQELDTILEYMELSGADTIQDAIMHAIKTAKEHMEG